MLLSIVKSILESKLLLMLLPSSNKQHKLIFLTLGGDVGNSEVDWKPGFIGIAHVIREPYAFGYNGKPKNSWYLR